MGANKNSIWRKCGFLFVDTTTLKNKSKIFAFHCTLCNINFDQLKKFAKHFENHLEYYQSQAEHLTESSSFVETERTQDKTEFVVQLNEHYSDALKEPEALQEYNDPLETDKLYKIEKTENEGETESATNCLVLEDMSSDYLSDCELELEEEPTAPKSIKHVKESNLENCDKPKKRRRTIIESILPFLIQQYKKYETLWQIDDIGFGIKIKKYEIFTQIAEAIKLEKHRTLSLEDISWHINHLNDLYSKDKEQELRSQMENVQFVPEYEHYKEMSFLSHSQGPFLCATCNEILPRYHAYCQHRADHNDSQPYKCPLCESTFVNYHKYLVHKKRHLGILDFHCKICGKGYMFKNDLEWHVTSHTGVKPYLCPICGTGFRARHGYDNHVRRHEERYRHECHICKRGFNQLHALNSHVKSHLNIRDVLCKICGKGFVHSKYLKRHELIHGKEKHYKCNECGKAFFQSCGLRAHRKNHHS